MHRRTTLTAALLFGVTLAGNSCGTPTPMSLVPANYRATFVQVRNCRTTLEHTAPAGQATQISNIVVYVNPEAAAAYNANQNPLPANTLVIKEEHDDPGCTHVIAHSVSRKEPGFDTDHGDWHWQHVLADGSIDADGREERCTNTACHGASACRVRDWMCTDP